MDGLELPGLRGFMEEKVGIDLSDSAPAQVETAGFVHRYSRVHQIFLTALLGCSHIVFKPTARGVSAPVENTGFVAAVQDLFQLSFDGNDRVFHSHGIRPPCHGLPSFTWFTASGFRLRMRRARHPVDSQPLASFLSTTICLRSHLR